MSDGAPDVDVCLLLEGTYPYVRGGVSSWMHQIIEGLPELRFALVFIGGRRSDYAQPRYTLPANVVSLQTHYLQDALRGRQPRRTGAPAGMPALLTRLHAAFAAAHRPSVDGPSVDGPSVDGPSGCPLSSIADTLDTVLRTAGRRGGITAAHFLGSDAAWAFVRQRAADGDGTTPFTDYFWTLRQMHGPIFQLAEIADAVPDARVYHTISTGYAGLLGAFIERRRGRPLVLSEHGIYTKERRIDLNQAEWLDDPARVGEPGLRDPSGRLRSLRWPYSPACCA